MERKLKVLLIDDEQHCLDTLRFDLKRHCSEQVIIIAEVQNVVAATKEINKSQPDLIFLDINLPGMTGLEFLESLGSIESKVIFTTAHSEYAVPAYKFKAEAFLVKPIDANELKEIVYALHESITSVESSFSKSRLAINDLQGTSFIPYDEIIFCASNDNYCLIHLKDGIVKTVSKTLKFIELAIEDSTFLRVHQSYLVNTNYITKYLRSDGGSLEMENGKIIPVSKAYREKLRRFLRL